jgi:hypothetical protein
MKKLVLAKAAMISVALVSLLVVIAHMSCIWLGPECFYVQRAPLSIIESSKNGTWFAPIGTTFVSSLFLVCSFYALSGGGIIRKLPLLKVGIYTIGSICIARGFLITPVLYSYPHLRSTFEILAAIIWLACGVLIIWGFKTNESKNS